MRSIFALTLAAIPAALAVTYDVEVAPGGELVYSPEYVAAQAGDTVRFTFNPKAHTVTQSNFESPCVANGGFDTDFQPVSPELVADNSRPVVEFTVEETSPLWFYCRQVGHCGQGMVFAINPPAEGSERSFSAFKHLAIQQNGTDAASSTSPPVPSVTSPPEPHWESATATVTSSDSVWVTTYTSYDGTPAPTFAPEGPQDHLIIVGDSGENAYNPANITGVAIGDTVTFEFRPKNHTVTQSSFSNPCQRLEGGFASGFTPVSAEETEFPAFQIVVNDTAPIWGYCGQGTHCESDGMVFSINAVESGPNNFAAFQALAKGELTSGTGSGSGSDTDSDSGSDSDDSGSGSDSSGNDNGATALSMSGALIVMASAFFGYVAL